MNPCSFFWTAVALALFPAVAEAATIITPTNVTATTSLRASNPIGSTIDGSGLSGGGLSGDILSETHAFASTGDNDFYWLSGSNAGKSGSEVITFTVATTDVDTVHIWQYGLENDDRRQIQTATLTFSSDGVTYGNQVVLNVTRTAYSGSIPVQSFTFDTVEDVTSIRMLVENEGGGTDFIGLSEVRFGVVPEPSVALLGSLGVLALLRRRR